VGIVYLEAPQSPRAYPVPEAAIARMLARWELPDLAECHTLRAVLT